jgi:hypothetical protein
LGKDTCVGSFSGVDVRKIFQERTLISRLSTAVASEGRLAPTIFDHTTKKGNQKGASACVTRILSRSEMDQENAPPLECGGAKFYGGSVERPGRGFSANFVIFQREHAAGFLYSRFSRAALHFAMANNASDLPIIYPWMISARPLGTCASSGGSCPEHRLIWREQIMHLP